MPRKPSKKNGKSKKPLLSYKNIDKGLTMAAKVASLAMTVAKVAKMVNAEKQNADSTSTTVYDLAQLNGAASGGFVIDITPSIAQGVSEDQRKGDSLKIVSWCCKVNIQTASFNTLQDTKYKIYILRQPINPVATGSTMANFLEANPFSGYADYYSNRDYEHYKDFIVMGVINGKLGPNTNDSLNQYRSNVHTLARKQEFHLRYDKGTTTIINNPIYLLAVASEGNIATGNKLTMQYNMKVYYYDN